MIRNIFYNSKTAKVDIKSQISDKIMVALRYQNTVFIDYNIMIHYENKYFISLCQIITSAGP